jgi:thioredoxin 1
MLAIQGIVSNQKNRSEMRASRRTLLRGLAALGVAGGLIAASWTASVSAQYAAIYPHTAQASGDLAAAQRQALKEQKRILVDFGGNWCGDCRALDANFKQPDNAKLLATYYVLVHVNVGDEGVDHNLDIAERYGIPLKKGVPALAVIEPSGAVVYAQQNGEFESMRKMDPKSVSEFLNRWKPGS